MPGPSVATPPSASSRASACLSVTSRSGYHVSEGNGARYGFYPCILLAPSPLLLPPPFCLLSGPCLLSCLSPSLPPSLRPPPRPFLFSASPSSLVLLLLPWCSSLLHSVPSPPLFTASYMAALLTLAVHFPLLFSLLVRALFSIAFLNFQSSSVSFFFCSFIVCNSYGSRVDVVFVNFEDFSCVMLCQAWSINL